MKPVFAIPLFLLALPMVAAEAPMSYVRFTTPDPLALSYPFLSPYAYCANNPNATWIWMGRKYVLQKECTQNSNSNSLQR